MWETVRRRAGGAAGAARVGGRSMVMPWTHADQVRAARRGGFVALGHRAGWHEWVLGAGLGRAAAGVGSGQEGAVHGKVLMR